MKCIHYVVATVLALCSSMAISAEASSALPFSIRAFQCEQYEFAELDSMPAPELKGAFCSYAAGSDRSKKQAAAMTEKYKDNPTVRSALLGDHIALLQQCTKGMEKVLDTLRRKFAEQPSECAPMISMIESRMAKAKAASTDAK